jgi:hypothetical protein
MSVQTETQVEQRRAAKSRQPYRYSIWHHPRVFRSSNLPGWTWECGCGSSSHAFPHVGQRAATLAAIAHVHSRVAYR